MNLISLETLESCQAKLDDRIQQLVTPYAIDLDHPIYGAAFRWYLLFTHAPDLVADVPLDDLFYNRYFWLRRFANLHASVHGKDAGVEQQLFQLLENTEIAVDWSCIERMDNLACSTG